MLSKIHKSLVNENPKLRPILFTIHTGTYKGIKCFFVYSNRLVLISLKIIFKNSESVVTFLYVDSFFTNVQLDETIDISIRNSFKTKHTASVHGKQKVSRMLLLTTKENIPSRDEKHYSYIA